MAETTIIAVNKLALDRITYILGQEVSIKKGAGLFVQPYQPVR